MKTKLTPQQESVKFAKPTPLSEIDCFSKIFSSVKNETEEAVNICESCDLANAYFKKSAVCQTIFNRQEAILNIGLEQTQQKDADLHRISNLILEALNLAYDGLSEVRI